ncbi:PucR family transcriptional regulator [Amycolatopsis sp. WAC 01376]|uniref:PucR family transcriptional regulator n=1 Tax=Amycolatopsis sp. WAC 01376 TaxID=2203195 RepID=UPI000F7901E8|nr:PucR family transcriptional regulator [Amycolatopsis sp. WAC 01376]RSM57368.1 PucR family transcriptional regulator [Amycolatopsis sp. WAC 01376]
MLTLAALADDPDLELRVVVPGRDGALTEQVLWVHNTELPDPGPYVREHEVVLTNGLWLDRVEPAEFVARVVGAGAAGIIFGLRVEQRDTPPALAEACREAGLPLLEISVAVPFTAVTRAAAAIQAADRQNALMSLVRRGDELTSALSRGAGTSGVLAVLRREHELPLAVVDRMGRELASDGAELDAGQSRAAAEALAGRPPPLEADLGAGTRAALFPVGAIGDADAALLCLRPAADLTREERDALEQTARYLSLEVARHQAVQAIEMRFAVELLDMVLSGAQRVAEVPGRLRAFGVDPDGPLSVIALAFAGDDAATRAGMAEAVTDFLLADGLPAVVAAGSRDVVAVLPFRSGRQSPAAFAPRLAAAVSHRLGGGRGVVGLADPVSGAAELREPLSRSREACRVLRGRRGGPVAASFAELGSYRLLLESHDEQWRHTFADALLGPLREHDRLRDGDLETTLRAFLDHDGQWAATAAALYVHVNTLRNRLAKVTELTGRDVGRTADRVDLFLALEAAQSG